MRLRRRDVKPKPTGPLQSVLEQFIESQTHRDRVLPLLLEDILEQQGVKLPPEAFARFVEEVKRRLDAGDDESSFEFDFDLPEPRHVDLNVDAETFARFEDKLVKSAEEEAVSLTESVAATAFETVRNGAAQAASEVEADTAAFQRRLQIRWQKPLSLLTTQIALAQRLGEERNAWLRSESTDEDHATIEALTRLHARACQVACEVEQLLRGGFADGALSRWRTLQEVVVVSFFIQEKGNELAERYLDHLHVDSLRLAEQFNKAHAKLGHAEIDAHEMQGLEDRASGLKAKYGKEFLSGYGWASGFVNGKQKEPSFWDIEEAVQFERLRPYYKLASATVHAGPKGAFWRLGMLHGTGDGLLAGASNAGLDEAGRLTALSLGWACVPLIQIHPVLDATVWANVIIKLSYEVEDAFIAAGRKLSDEQLGGTHRKVQLPERLMKLEGRGAVKPTFRRQRRI